MTIGSVQVRLSDGFIFLLSIAVITAMGLKAYGQPNGDRVAVVTSPEGQWIYPLSTEKRFVPTGVPGECIVTIGGGSVQVVESNCPKQICVRMGRISRPGQWIACLPHRVFIQVEGRDREAFDAVNF